VALPLEKAQLFYARRCVMIFREIIAVYFENRMPSINTCL